MRATVEGLITFADEQEKGTGETHKKFTEVLLLQAGERMQVRVRVPGHGKKYELMTPQKFSGRVMAWGKRSGEADYMLMVD